MSGKPTPSATLHRFAAPMLDVLGTDPKPERLRQALEVAVAIWNAVVLDEWEETTRYTAAARGQIVGEYPELVEVFDGMAERKREDFPRESWGVTAWSLDRDEDGAFRLAVEARLRSD
ncbi:MAG: hypothetical protein R3F20_17480 [Planctomycetota bacterium]